VRITRWDNPSVTTAAYIATLVWKKRECQLQTLARQSGTADFAPDVRFSGATWRVTLNNSLCLRLQAWFYIWPTVWKPDVIHKTGTIQRVTLSSEEDRATATINMYSKFREVWTSGFEICQRADTSTDIQTRWCWSQYFAHLAGAPEVITSNYAVKRRVWVLCDDARVHFRFTRDIDFRGQKNVRDSPGSVRWRTTARLKQCPASHRHAMSTCFLTCVQLMALCRCWQASVETPVMRQNRFDPQILISVRWNFSTRLCLHLFLRYWNISSLSFRGRWSAC